MGAWGNEPFESDSQLCYRAEAVRKHCLSIEHELRNWDGTNKVVFLDFTMAASNLLYGIAKHCGQNVYGESDVDRWLSLLERISIHTPNTDDELTTKNTNKVFTAT